MNEPVILVAERALLAEACALARRSAGPPRERAGAIAVTRDGVSFPGVAVRIPGSPSLSVCAVPAALGAARAGSGEPVTTIALWIPATASEQPCGLCLQIWRELAPAARFLLQRESGEPQVLALAERLPDPFTHFEPTA
jgi:cytidine deaminase